MVREHEQRFLLDCYRKLLVDAFMGKNDDNFEAARVGLCQLIGKDPTELRKRVYEPRHHMRRYTAEQVREMRLLHATGTKMVDLRRKFEAVHTTIQNILEHKTYKDVQ